MSRGFEHLPTERGGTGQPLRPVPRRGADEAADLLGSIVPGQRRAAPPAVEPLDASIRPALTSVEPASTSRVPLGLDDHAPSEWLRHNGLWLEIGLSVLVGLSLGLGTGGPTTGLLLVLLVWVLSNFHAGRAVTSPLGGQLRQSATSAVPALAFAALTVGFAAQPVSLIQHAVPAVVAASTVSVVCRMLRWRLQAPVRVLVVGDRVGAAQVVARFTAQPRSTVVGAVVAEADIDRSDIDPELLGVPVAMGLDAVAGAVQATRADLVLVNPGPGFSSDDLKRLQRSLEDLDVALGLMGVLDAVAPHRVRAGWAARSTVLDIRPSRPSALVRLVKWVIDRSVAAVAIVALAPLMAVLMVLVKLDSPGPAIFRQTRVGRDGRHFELYKLRTMVADAEETKSYVTQSGHNDVADSLLFKLRRDPRITRTGRFLRRYSLDELPQMFNVLKGEMSLVGPRPYLPEETAQMDPEALRRLAVQPGLTGLWQVSGRSDLPWDEAIGLDTYYADNWSVGNDLKIIAQTVPAVIDGRGAY